MTQLAHQYVGKVVRSGDTVIDATAGNGLDTLELARLTGETGRVIAVDIQETAIESTRRRVRDAGYDHVEYRQQSHSEEIPVTAGTVSAVMFNLGYLPGGDKALTTSPDSTRVALEQSIRLLRNGGIVTVVAYRGHPGGQAEAQIVQSWWQTLRSDNFQKHSHESSRDNPTSPVLYVAWGRKQQSQERRNMEDSDNTIELDRFLKLAQVVSSGGQAKHLIREGGVQVNGEPETRRGRKLRPGDVVTVQGEDYVIEADQ